MSRHPSLGRARDMIAPVKAKTAHLFELLKVMSIVPICMYAWMCGVCACVRACARVCVYVRRGVCVSCVRYAYVCARVSTKYKGTLKTNSGNETLILYERWINVQLVTELTPAPG